MDFLGSLDLFGVDTKEIPCITGPGAPTTSTEARLTDAEKAIATQKGWTLA